MALRKAAKIWIIILAIPVTLIIVAMVAAKLYFTSDRLKALVIPKIESATHRTVAIKDISLSVFPTLAVSIDSLSISNPQGTHYDRENFLSLDNLRLRVKILPLISNRIEIGYVILDHPQIYLEVTKDGHKNYSSEEPGTAKESSVSVKVEKGGTGELLLSNFEINNGEFESVNKKFDSRMKVGGLHLSTKIQAKPGESTIQVDGETAIDQFSYGTTSMWYLSDQPVTANLHLSYDVGRDALNFDDVTGKLKAIPLTVSGNISQLTRDTMMMDLKITAPNVQMEHLLSLVPAEMLKTAQGLSASGDVKLIASIVGPSSKTVDPGIQATFAISNGSIRYTSLPKAITNINLNGSFEEPSAPIDAPGIGKLSVDKLTAHIGGNDISASLHVISFTDPAVVASLNGSLSLGEVKDFYPLEQGSELAGLVKANVSLDGKAKAPQSIRASGSIEFQNVAIKTAGSPKPLRNLNGTITFSNQAIESKQLAVNIGESDMQMSFALHNYLGMVMTEAAKSAGKPNATVTLTSHQLRTADLMSEEASAPSTGEKKKSEKKGGANSTMLPGVDANATVSIDKLVTDKFTFTNARGSLALSNGIITLKNFTVNAFDGTIQTKGTLDLRDTLKRPFNLDLAISNVESHEMLPKFTTFGNYLYGKLTMNTKMQGDLNDTLGINTQTLLGDGKVLLNDGKVNDLPLASKLADFTNLSELRQVNFKDWTNAFSIQNGRFVVKDLKINSGATSFLVGGSQGLDGSLDYVLTVKLPATVSDRLKLQGVGNELMQFFKDKDGRINLSFAATGTSSSPSLRLDTQAQQELAKQALEQKKQQLINQATQKTQDALKGKAEDALKKLFKKP